ALALAAEAGPRWVSLADQIVGFLAVENILSLREWTELLEPVRAKLVPHAARRLAEADVVGFMIFLAILRAYPDDARVALLAILHRSLPAIALGRSGVSCSVPP